MGADQLMTGLIGFLVSVSITLAVSLMLGHGIVGAAESMSAVNNNVFGSTV